MALGVDPMGARRGAAGFRGPSMAMPRRRELVRYRSPAPPTPPPSTYSPGAARVPFGGPAAERMPTSRGALGSARDRVFSLRAVNRRCVPMGSPSGNDRQGVSSRQWKSADGLLDLVLHGCHSPRDRFWIRPPAPQRKPLDAEQHRRAAGLNPSSAPRFRSHARSPGDEKFRFSSMVSPHLSGSVSHAVARPPLGAPSGARHEA